jgi:hypothetical protein
MKRVFVAMAVASTLVLGGCQSFQKDRDIELLVVGSALTYAGGKWLCRKSEHAEKCGAALAGAFIIWY